MVEVREFAEDLEAGFDLLAGQVGQALGPEAFDGERSHHAAVEHGALEHLAVQLALRSDVSHEASGEGIAGAGGIAHLLDRQSGSAEGMAADAERALAEKDGRAVFAVLHHQPARPAGQNFIGGARQAGIAGQHFGLGIVDQQHVDELQRLRQFLRLAVDPVIHGVAAHQPRVAHLPPHPGLQQGIDVGEEEKVGVEKFLRDLRVEILEDVQLGEVGLGFVEVLSVLSRPEERFAAGMLDAVGGYAAALRAPLRARR